MALNGSGVYTPPSPEYPAIPNTTILASDFNTIISDLATALSLAIFKDGQNPMAANLNLATFKITNLGTGVAPADAVNFLQVFTDPTFTGTTGDGVAITGTKSTIDVATLQIDSTAMNVTGTLTLTGDTSTPNLAITDDSTKIANTHYVQQMAFSAALPLTTVAAGKVVAYDGVDIKWQDLLDSSVLKFANGADPTKLVTLDLSGMTTGTTKTLVFNNNSFNFTDPTDPTKKAHIVASSITAGQDRSMTIADRNIILDTPAYRWLETVTAASSTTLDLTAFDSSKYSDYLVIISGMDLGTTNDDLLLQLTIGGTLRTANYYYHTNVSAHSANTYAGLNGSNVSAIVLADDLGTKPSTQPSASIHLYLFDIANTAKYPLVKWVGGSSMPSAVGFKEASGMGGNSNLGAITTARLLASTGVIKDGTAHLYGIRRS